MTAAHDAGTGSPVLTTLKSKDDWTGVAPKPPLRLPRTQRALYELLALYTPDQALDDFLLRLDCSDLAPGDIYRMVFGRVPDDPALVLPRPDYNARQHLRGTLLSPEFRAGLLGSFLAAFPEKRRDVFIHVPKTAGTDLTLNLWPRRVSFPVSTGTIGTSEDVLRYCAHIARHMPVTDDIFVHGHIELGHYLAAAGARLGDRFYTTVREPVDLLISQVSDLLGQFLRDPEAKQDNTRRWLGFLGLDHVPVNPLPRQIKELWAAALLNPKIAEPNNICRYLSHAGAVSYEAAMLNAVAYDVEITTTSRYSRWLAERWGVQSASRHNASRRLLDTHEVDRFLRGGLGGQMAEDEKFYAVVEWAFGDSNAVSITGAQIAERVGPRLLSGFADELVARNRDGGPKPFWVVRGEQRAAMYREPIPEALTGVRENVIQTVVFGAGGNGHWVQREGWSAPGNGGTWTEQDRAVLAFEVPPQEGLLVFQAQIRPFIATTVINRQRVRILANGYPAGEAAIGELSVIDCTIPPGAMRHDGELELTFLLPDAAKSRESAERAHDPRSLSLFFETARLVRLANTEPPAPAPAADGVVSYSRAPYLKTPGAAGRAATGMDAPLASLEFGHTGNAGSFQAAGWSRGEQGYTWTNAATAELLLPRPEVPGRYLVRAHVAPFLAAGRITSQRVAVAINGIALGEVTIAGPVVVDCDAGWETLSREDAIRIGFTLPDAARPSEVAGHPNDTRLLGLSFQRLWLTGPLAGPAAAVEIPAEDVVEPDAKAESPAALAGLMLQFESLGENCEFGLVQRANGAEPLGLFRFASAPLPLLLRALAARFVGMGEPGNLLIEVSPNGREYMVLDKRFNFRYHAWAAVDDKTPAEVLAREVRRLPFLIRKLIDDLAEGSKIFVYRSLDPMGPEDAAVLVQAIRAYGPGTLLWMDLADADHPPGTVIRLGDGLLKGHMDRFAPGENAHDLSLECWNTVCTAAVAALSGVAPAQGGERQEEPAGAAPETAAAPAPAG